MEDPSVSSQSLPAGTRVQEFVIERVLGSGGFGITYLASDTALGRQVVIKENLPVQFCFRDTHSMTVAPRHAGGEDAENFQWSLENFSKEAAMLASLDHSGIVKVLRSFEAFGTAYFVMPFVEGMALDELVKARAGEPFPEEELRMLLDRVLEALAHLHDRGIYHRDIKPGNILISNEGIPVLIDFGSARQRLSERSMTVVESAGYTPFEQLQSRGNVGPWSDLYALGGTLVKVMTGETPPKAMDRMRKDPYQALAGRADLESWFKSDFLHAIDKALIVDEENRWQDAEEWLAALRCKPRTRGGYGGGSKSALARIWEQMGKVTSKEIFKINELNRLSQEPNPPAPQPTAPAATVAEAIRTDGDQPPHALDCDDADDQQHQPGEERDFDLVEGCQIRMCWIPPGEFVMGSPEGEYGSKEDEAQHLVRIAQGFWIGKYPVTQGQWWEVMGTRPSFFGRTSLLSYVIKSKHILDGAAWDYHPVESVSWRQISDSGGFIDKVNQLAGRDQQFALPNEEQWEYACRAGTNGAYAGKLDQMAWYLGNSGGKTHPVGNKNANPWGLHDMHGNVCEWCENCYSAYHQCSPEDFQAVDFNSDRVIRGGCWRWDKYFCRSASRSDSYPGLRDNSLGFRLVLRSSPHSQ